MAPAVHSLRSIGRILHSDWSKTPNRRWSCWAERRGKGWMASGPVPHHETDVSAFFGRDDAALAGFDFPIGIPAFWARQAGIGSFHHLLDELVTDRHRSFFKVADQPEDISLWRPFFPNSSRRGVRRSSLLNALGACDMNVLMRACERATPDRRAACSVFWTLGGQQVGKAALSGWQEVVLPFRKDGAKVWPFDGELRSLAEPGVLILAETYPAEAYRHVGIAFGHGRSKRRQADRKLNARAFLNWAERASVQFCLELSQAIHDGFGDQREGEDKFDALAGLAGMIEVLDGRRPEAPPADEARAVEGWILGQVA